MKQIQTIKIVLLLSCFLVTFQSHAQNPVYFEFNGTGQTKAMTQWGADTAWPSFDNMRQCIQHMGADQIDVIRLNFYTDEALINGQIGPNSRSRIDYQLSIAATAGDKPLALTPSSGEATDPWYLNGPDEVWVDRWVQLLEATQAYIGKPIAEVEPFNEPDYWDGQGTPQNLYDILVALKSSPHFQDTKLVAASTLNSDWAVWWYNQIAGPVDYGSTHQLAGSTDSYVNLIQSVIANGDAAYNPELHSIAEVLYGCEYGMSGGIWWAETLRPRGLLVNACQGKRLGYAENRGTFSAAAVYRNTDSQVYGFAGSFERQGALTYYRFICTDQDVYYNGVGPIREYMLETYADPVGGYLDIDSTPPDLPVLDGHRWKIANRQTGEVMEVVNAGTSDGDNIRTAADANTLRQKWDIVRNRAGYYALINANSRKTAEVENWATWNGANIRQWGTADSILHLWWIEDAGDGYFYIRNGHSNLYMDADLNNDNIIQWEGHGGVNQQWYFIPADPAANETMTARYEFEGNASDSTGSNHGTAYGSPSYTTGRIGQAINLDGVNDYVVLPTGVANSNDITVAAWVNWDGGDAWQRIFDFGNDTTSYMFLTPSSWDGTMRFAITTDGNTNEQILETDALPTGQWIHVAVILDGNTGIMYIDGKPRVAGQILLNPSDILPVNNYIGESQWPDPLFNGRIDDFRIYNYALSDEQIAALTLPPSFTDDPIINTDAIELKDYTGQSLTNYVNITQEANELTYSKITGPDWLVVSSDGTLSGIPKDSNVGQNIFTVRVENQMEISDTATMTIQVANIYSGVRGMEDLAGLAAQWLATGCSDTPACGGADLNGDAEVTILDFSILSHNWMSDEL